jgi:hypothetical protein
VRFHSHQLPASFPWRILFLEISVEQFSLVDCLRGHTGWVYMMVPFWYFILQYNLFGLGLFWGAVIFSIIAGTDHRDSELVE